MSQFRSTVADLARLLDDGRAPLYVLDEDRRIVYCNAACAEWLGMAAENLVGQQCSYRAPRGDEAPAEVAVALCPPPQTFAGQPRTGTIRRVRPGGEVVRRRGYFLPLADGRDEGAPVLAVLDVADCPAEAVSQASSGVLADAQLHEAVRCFRQQTAGRFSVESLIGNSPRMARVRSQIDLAAQSRGGVLIVGPAGSGKNHAAKAIHYSRGDDGLFVPLDCHVLETNVLRMALRTMAAKAAGRAARSTVVLENVEGLPSESQDELLDLLRGGSPALAVIASSTRTLAELDESDRLSHELVCALSPLVIEMPALAERIDDLPLLAQAMVEEQNAVSLRQVAGFSSEALDHLAAYPWPGNLDELAALVREVHEQAAGCEIAAHDLPKRIQWGAEAAGHAARGDEPIVLVEFLSRVERELIARAMRRAKGNKSKAAKFLGLTRPRLYRRLVQLGFELPRDAEPRT